MANVIDKKIMNYFLTQVQQHTDETTSIQELAELCHHLNICKNIQIQQPAAL